MTEFTNPITLHQGDANDVLASLPEQSVHAVVTSPPYWGLRDYGVDGQLGLEPTPEEYVANMVEVFQGVWRVLRDDGTLWLNIGDSYAGSYGSGTSVQTNIGLTVDSFTRYQNVTGRGHYGLKPKDLVGIPWRLAFALQSDGWYLRSDIIWSKPNPMPESVTDRPTKAHEYLFLLTKKPRYYYDAEAIREPAQEWGERDRGNGKYKKAGLANGLLAGQPAEAGHNKRTVWTIATQPYKEAHFATFPEKLVEPCIKAGTSEWGVCAKCGAPYERIVDREPMRITRSFRAEEMGEYGRTRSSGTMTKPAKSTTQGWRKTCKHIAAIVPATVLDPFAGSGTALIVAKRMGRSSVGIELSPEYCDLIRQRDVYAQSVGL